MNKRIRELELEAIAYADSKVHANDRYNDIYHSIVLGKFAELIVRECAKFMDENSGYNDSDGCWFPEPEDMLKHFGVEE